MRRHLRAALLTCVLALVGSERLQAQANSCDGDLNGDARVTIDELVKAVNSALTDCADKVTCTSNGDCDADEVCTDGLCTSQADACTSNADCDSDEHCVDGNCQ